MKESAGKQRPGAAVPIRFVPVAPLDLGLLASVLDADQAARLMGAAERARAVLDGRVVWNVNSTARGGGVAEMLAVAARLRARRRDRRALAGDRRRRRSSSG